MTRLKVHHQGWLSLPERFRQKLGVASGGEIEAELVDGTIVLRPSKGSAKAIEEGIAPEAELATPVPSVLAAEAQEPEQHAAAPEAPPAPKRRGRPPKARA